VLRYVYVPLFVDAKELGVARGGEYGDASLCCTPRSPLLYAVSTSSNGDAGEFSGCVSDLPLALLMGSMVLDAQVQA
jgi:hypothetical protein